VTDEVPNSVAPDIDDPAVANEPRNLFVLALYHVTLRFSWIFKTESVIIPRFLDVIDGSGFMRGWLPMLNRTGQSLPPLLMADRLRQKPLKRKSLLVMSMMMGLGMLSLAGIWWWLDEPVDRKCPSWLPIVFLTIYVAFFVVSGLNQLALGTLQGKLIRANRRGKLMAVSGVVGSIIAVLLAWFLLQAWLAPPTKLPSSGYVLIFGFAGVGFIVAGLLAPLLREHADDESDRPKRKMLQAFTDAWTVFSTDQAFRRVAIVGMLFISVQLLFPHFQAFGRNRWGNEDEHFHLMLWVIAQNASVGGFSWISGFIADRYGNRLAIRIQVMMCTMTPLIALFLTSAYVENGLQYYWIAFVFLGLVPVTMKTIMNYTLELTNTSNHPRYVSTMSLCFAVPFVFSPIVGWLMDQIGFELIFLTIAGLIALSGMLTFRMSEPRNTVIDQVVIDQVIE
jgi:MFS family permease